MFFLKEFFVLISMLSFGSVYTQTNETILWKESKRLSWSDFKATPAEDSSAAAITASGISYSYATAIKNGAATINYMVSTFFYPNNSWYKPALCDDVILSHEQLHFDITELYARKMREQLARVTVSKNTKAQIRAIYKTINKELAAYQDEYDTTTNYSRDKEQQLEWNKKIAKELSKKK